MRIYLQKSADGNDTPRFYHIVLQEDLIGGWTLVREWGVQGARGRVVQKNFATLEQAQEEMVRIRDQQIRNGFRVVFTQGLTTPPVNSD